MNYREFLIDMYLPAAYDAAVQCKFAAEALNNIAQNIHVVSERIGVEGGHVAAASKIMDPDHHGANE